MEKLNVIRAYNIKLCKNSYFCKLITNIMATHKYYMMHKYWGKKPADGLTPLLEKYTKPGDTVLDPFSGYGVFGCEAFLYKRNAIVNDLNPIANFISRNLLNQDFDIDLVQNTWSVIKKEMEAFVNDWYSITINGKRYTQISVLRNKENIPLQFTYKDKSESKKIQIKDIPNDVAKEYLFRESKSVIVDWYPDELIIENSRISASSGLRVFDLFTKRTLACHARLFALINQHSSGVTKDLFLLAFTANLANCSKLVPPIKSRGSLAQGAWMTGFYIGDTYIENNVLHYFENRLSKVINGKLDYIRDGGFDGFLNNNDNWYKITSFDAKHLNIDDKSIDFVFTDPPYGDSVPYFEQSVIWNSWLHLKPDYPNEIVISDSNFRNKDIDSFTEDIYISFSEIRRVLKDNHYFSLTFHSLSGLEWKAVSNACVRNNFRVVEYEWLEQKTYPPRQLNRLKSIKGDVLVTFLKSTEQLNLRNDPDDLLRSEIINLITVTIQIGLNDTNSIMMTIMEWILRNMVIVGNVDVFEILNSNFSISEDGHWTL